MVLEISRKGKTSYTRLPNGEKAKTVYGVLFWLIVSLLKGGSCSLPLYIKQFNCFRNPQVLAILDTGACKHKH